MRSSRKLSDGTFLVQRACNFFNTWKSAGIIRHVHDAHVSLYLTGKENTDNDGQDYLSVVQASSTFTSASSIVSGDYDNGQPH